MKAVVLFSGGKDSALALNKALEKHDVVALVSMFPKTSDSFMFHKPNLKLLKKQAERLGIKLVIGKTKAEEEKELGDLVRVLKKVKEKEKAEVLVIGGIKSSYQSKRIKKIASELGMEVYAPLWNYRGNLWEELLRKKFKVIITKISCEGISREFIGKIIDGERFKRLKELSRKYKFRLDFEGGEAETAVLWMPGFKREIKLKYGIDSEDKYRHFIKIKKIT